jgi:hypothetical protein
MSQLKTPVDNSIHFKHTEYHLRDKLYNKIVARYGAKGNLWTSSDTFVFGGFLYFIWDYFIMVLFLWLIYFAANFFYEKYGLWRAISFLFVVILIRINMLIRVQNKIDKTIHS